MSMADSTPAELLKSWIARHAAPAAMVWLEQKCADVAINASGRTLGLAISTAPR